MAVATYARYLQSAASVVNVHSPGSHMPLKELLTARLAGLPVITSVHGYDAGRRARTRGRLQARLGSAMSTAVVAMNKVVFRQQLEQGIAAKKLRLIYNGVADVTKPIARSEARHELGVADTCFMMASFGRLVPDKGIDTLIQAMNRLPADLLSVCRLFIGGIGPELDSLQRLMTAPTRAAVTFLGHVDHTGLYYAASDLFVLPSRHEPFGLVFLEAAQYGLACIGTSVGGIPEIILDGETGILVPPEDPDQLAAYITSLSRDQALRRKLGDAAKQRVRTHFAMDTMVDGYAQLFYGVLGKPGR